MKRLISLLLIPIFALAMSGCYSAQVTTGKDPGRTIEKQWATGLINGLATPGANIDVAQRCENGVARVESEISFLNLLANGITFGIYSPMSVTVTCAAGGSMSSVMPPPNFEAPSGVDEIETTEILHSAALESAKADKPVRVKMDR